MSSYRVLTSVVDLARARVDSLEQLVDLLVGHLLAQIRQDVLELADADEACHVLVEDLESAAVLLGDAGVAEAAWPVQDALEGLEVDCQSKSAPYPLPPQTHVVKLTLAADILLEVLDLGERGVLAAGAKEVAQIGEDDATVAALVVQGESLLVVGRRLGVELVRRHDCQISSALRVVLGCVVSDRGQLRCTREMQREMKTVVVALLTVGAGQRQMIDAVGLDPAAVLLFGPLLAGGRAGKSGAV